MSGLVPTSDGPGAWWRTGRRRWAWVAVGVVVLVLAAYGIVHAVTATAGTTAKPPVTAAADTGPVITQVATSGTVEPAQTRSLSFTVGGTVTGVQVTPGQAVTPGQKLATVDTTAATVAVDSAQEALDQAQTALTQAQTASTGNGSAARGRATGCATGSNVPAGFHPTTSPSPTAKPSPTARPGPTPTRTPTKTATSTAGPARTRSPAPTRSPATHRSRTAPAPDGSTCATSGGGGNQAGGGTDPVLSAEQRVNQATATLEDAQDALDGTTITAPIAGKILAVDGKVGSQVGAGSAFITLADVYTMQIDAAFPEADADHLAVREAATVSLADRPGQTFKATVVQVDPVGTSDGTMVRYGVVLSFADAPTDLLVGQSANVVVTTGSVPHTLRVPSTAVHGISGSTGTVLRGQGGATSQVRVGVGLIGDQYTQITSGLAAGDKVARSW